MSSDIIALHNYFSQKNYVNNYMYYNVFTYNDLSCQ